MKANIPSTITRGGTMSAQHKILFICQHNSGRSQIVTVCHDSESQCPIFPGITKRWHLPFPDPAKAEGTREEKLAKVREIRDAIKKWLSDPKDGTFSYKALIKF
jgi:protein-tyrosine-phosphatase